MSLAVRGKAFITTVQQTRLGQLARRYREDHADLLVVIVAFNLLFSMFPIALGVLAIVGIFLRTPDDMAMAQAIVLSAVPASSAASLLRAIEGAGESAGWFGLLTLVGLLWAGSGLFDALQLALDRVYRVPSRSLVRQKVMGLGMMMLFSLLVVAVLAATAMAHFVGRIAQNQPLIEPGVAPAVALAGGAISLLAAFTLCFAIYLVVPNLRLAPGQVIPGTVFASVALVLLMQVFPLYAFYVGNLNPYGAIFGLFFLLMTWAFLVAEALVVGAELNAFLRPAASAGRPVPTLDDGKL